MSAKPLVEITVSQHFLAWLYQENMSLAFTTYQTNRLFLIGLKPDGSLSAFERLFDRPMGLFTTPQRIYLTTRFQIWELDNALPEGENYNGYDRMFVPRRAFTTGDVDAHDIAVTKDNQTVFVNTIYSCLATTSQHYSFKPLWKPPFISKLLAEDRCHLNGLALSNGAARYMTSVSHSDVVAGWRERRGAGGCLLDVTTNEILMNNLSMPHSPRVWEDRVWLLNSGTGQVGFFDAAAARFEPIAFCPGFMRGMAIHNGYAIVGLSKPRENRTFSGLELDEQLRARDADARCGLYVMDLRTGSIVHWLQIEGIVSELYDVGVLPGTRRPMALGFRTDEIHRLITIDNEARPIFHALTRVEAPHVTPPTIPSEPDESQTTPQLTAQAPPAFLREEYKRANALVKQGHADEAIPHYQHILQYQPEHVNANLNLGALLYERGEFSKAIQHYQMALRGNPKAIKAYLNLGLVYQRTGDAKNAIEHFRRALELEPENSEIQNLLGLAWYEIGNLGQAKDCFENAIRLRPNFAEAYNNLAGVMKLQDQTDAALAYHEQALAIDPTFSLAHENIGKIFEERGEIERARNAYHRGLSIEPDPVLAFHTELLAPSVMASNHAIDECREHAAEVLRRYADQDLKIDLSHLQSSRAEPPFDWAYHGRPDLPLLQNYAELFSRVLKAHRSRFTSKPLSRAVRHLGFIVTPGHEGVFMRCMRGIINQLPAAHFRVTLVCTRLGEPVLRSGITNESAHYLRMPLRFDHALDALQRAGFDILYFWEVGTDSTNYFLPFFRLAPVQCTSWGWPLTSAAPELDYFITSQWLTDETSQDQFTETLVCFKVLLPYFYRPPIPENPKPRSEFGLSDESHIYLCAQNLRKVHPDMDLLWSEILRRDPKGVLVVVGDKSDALNEMLLSRWGETMADVLSQVRLLPRLDAVDYFHLLAQSDVFLDTLGFGSANSMYDAVAAGVPVVTLPTIFLRGRYASAVYRVLDLPEAIAQSPREYVELALRLGTDRADRERLAAAIRDRATILFEDTSSVQQHIEFFASEFSKNA